MKNPFALSAILMALSAQLAFAQTAGAPPAPKDKAMDLPQAMLEAVARDITAKRLITQRVLEGGTFSVNVRHISGSETALQHGRITEVWVVREGSGIVATGGTLVDAKPGATAGEFSGSAIRGGVEREIKPGDLVFIPPGVPHGIKQSNSITYLNIRFEAREAKE
jgi:mannose-6-phosphate isomerase-like protein (cupin superfamily)